MNKNIGILYSCDRVNINLDETIVWDRCCCGSGVNAPALLDLIDENPEKFKRKFLAFLEVVFIELERELNSVCVEGFDCLTNVLWHSSRFKEMSNIQKSPAFTTLLKLFVLIEILTKQRYAKIYLVGFPSQIGSVLCRILDGCELVQPVRPSRIPQALQNSTDFVTRTIKLFGYFFIGFLRATKCSLSRNRKMNLNIPRSDIVFVDYLYEFAVEKSPKYKSSYWGDLPDQLEKSGKSLLWVHLFVPHSKTPDMDAARQILNRFNQAKQAHILIEDQISAHDIFRAMRLAFKIWFLSWKTRRKIRNDDLIAFWPVLEFEWIRSFESPELLKTLLLHTAFSRVLPKATARKSTVVYVCENQPWEHLLCRSAVTKGYTNIIASIQSSVRFWDFRYLQNIQRSFLVNATEKIAPTHIACNATEQEHLLAATPIDCLFQVESYRMGKSLEMQAEKRVRENFVIIAGEYSDSHTKALLKLVASVHSYAADAARFYFRPHPSSTLDIVLEFGDWLSYLPEHVDPYSAGLAITVANTSFSADCWEMGVPLACYVGVSDLNMSPVYGKQGVVFFSCPAELHSIIKNYPNFSFEEHSSRQIFNGNTGFAKWTSLLSEPGETNELS
jgi:surface carbohydrate biosynthesis protein (TIGR04326 family)